MKIKERAKPTLLPQIQNALATQRINRTGKSRPGTSRTSGKNRNKFEQQRQGQERAGQVAGTGATRGRNEDRDKRTDGETLIRDKRHTTAREENLQGETS